VPVGPQGEIQTLTLVTREKGEVKKTYITDVRFVPMTGEVQQSR
jgi:protein-L-isoaspartate O-methyltransferase